MNKSISSILNNPEPEGEGTADIVHEVVLTLVYMAGFLAQGVSIWYCLKSFSCTKHVFLLLLLDLITSLACTIGSIGKDIEKQSNAYQC